MSPHTVRWGILGAGGIATTVSRDIAATPGNALSAVAAREASRAEAFAAEHGVKKWYGSYAELLCDPDVDVVYIATTHGQHRDNAIMALEAGKPLLVEKAFTLNAVQAREVVAAARFHGLFCMEAMWMRFHPLVQRAVAIVNAGHIGELVCIRADLSRNFPYDPAHRIFNPIAGGGALLDLGVYPVTLAWLLLGRPQLIQAVGSLSPTGSDLAAALQFGYEHGAAAQIYCSVTADSPLGGLILGTRGWLRLEPQIYRPDRLVVHTTGPDEVFIAPAYNGNGYDLEIAEVARCIREGELESPVVPLDDTISILEILDEVRRQIGVRYSADAGPGICGEVTGRPSGASGAPAGPSSIQPRRQGNS